MLTRIDITNYRCFKSYQMDGLAQVNLIVGKNNSGKTALLEAINFATTGGDPMVLMEAAGRRGEMIEASESPRSLPDVTHFFYGHNIQPGSEFSIAAGNGHHRITAKLIDLPQDPELFAEEGSGFEGRPVMGLQIDGGTGLGAKVADLGLSERGGLIINRVARFASSAAASTVATPATVFVPTESMSGPKLVQLWRNVLLDAAHPHVVAAVKLVEQDIDEIIYVPSEGGVRISGSARNFFVKARDQRKPIPLGSFGDGSRRLMTLAIALARASKGTLLVDEIDTGLHYSVMAEMWRLIVLNAMAADVQVFATTHSWDCIEGLSLLCQREPNLNERVAIHAVDRKLARGVVYRGESIIRMVKHQIDPR